MTDTEPESTRARAQRLFDQHKHWLASTCPSDDAIRRRATELVDSVRAQSPEAGEVLAMRFLGIGLRVAGYDCPVDRREEVEAQLDDELLTSIDDLKDQLEQALRERDEARIYAAPVENGAEPMSLIEERRELIAALIKVREDLEAGAPPHYFDELASTFPGLFRDDEGDGSEEPTDESDDDKDRS